MDILAHALWTAAAAIPLRQRLRRPIHLGWVVFWGIFPDIFSFAIARMVRIWWYATGVNASLLPNAKSAQHFQFVWQLYCASHSLVTFAATFGIVWVVARCPVLEMLGWCLHILTDTLPIKGSSPCIFYGLSLRTVSPVFAGRAIGSWRRTTEHCSCCIGGCGAAAWRDTKRVSRDNRHSSSRGWWSLTFQAWRGFFSSTRRNPSSLLIPALSVAYVDHPGTFR
jgi:hypothetical protein